MKGTVSDIIVAILKKHGTQYATGLPAAQLSAFMDAVGREFEHITTRHEEAAAHMAHVLGRVTGKMAVCYATVGSGAANLVPGVAATYNCNVPVMVITGQNQTDQIYPMKEQFQCADQVGLFTPITKSSVCIYHAHRAPELVERAVQVAYSGRPGPVHLDVPCDVGTQIIEYDLDLVPAYKHARPRPSDAELESVAQLLAEAKRPILVAGGGVVRSEGTQAFRALLERTGFPATTTMMGAGIVPRASHQYIGGGGFSGGTAMLEGLQQADLIFAIGCKFSTMLPVHHVPAYPKPKGQTIIQLEIDGSTIGTTTPVDIGLVGDAKAGLEALLEHLSDPTDFSMADDWLPSLRKKFTEFNRRLDSITEEMGAVGTEPLVNEAAAAKLIRELLPDDALVSCDGGQTNAWGGTFLEFDEPNQYLDDAGNGHLGFGLPFANGAKWAFPDRIVATVVGDGAFGCTIHELETAARYGLNIISFVFNDSAWGSYVGLEEKLDNPNMGVRVSNVDFAKIAEGFGCYGERVAKLGDLEASYRRCLDSGKPAVLDIQVEFKPHPMDDYWGDVVLHGMQIPDRREPGAA